MKIAAIIFTTVLVIVCLVSWYWLDVVTPVRKEQEQSDDTENFYL